MTSRPLLESDEKLGELILHISQRCEDDPTFGAVKLNKILFFADALAFVRRGSPISGTRFMKRDQGPVARRMMPVQNALVQQGRLRVDTIAIDTQRTQVRTIALDSAQLGNMFSVVDIKFVDNVIEMFRPQNAKQASDLSHKMLGWEIAEDKEDIPLESAFILSFKASKADESVVAKLQR